ncbi:RluA family pseudouridine synthase [Candidatus Aquiluna sp. UB-MaderosW2red]|uniref:RluA family pseudouridine synthase n=1 Tax=Candidatus Aquiluna sp. UB-MaderosW2red TaxID=1855377 RepID=UPI000875E05D|nr:23S rRNA pseudouridine1911/1915/1917 synthase [Candidatus Aquiluna sp. UB-MaderosW2red]
MGIRSAGELVSKYLPVPDSLIGERADLGLSKMLGLSRSQSAELLGAGAVSAAGKLIGKSDRLTVEMLIEVVLNEKPVGLEITSDAVVDFKIIFQDDHIVVVDKPAGVVAHPSAGFDGPSVPGALLNLGVTLTTSGAPERQGIVQRLDVGTSGLMVLAKSERSYSVLKQAFRDRTVKKTYHALVQGSPEPSSGTIDTPIARSQKHDYKFTISPDGKPAVTHYSTIELLPAASLMKVGLETGRTHQIRVHFSQFRHPLVGDPLYGCDPKLASALSLERQWLHAMKLGFAHPKSGKWVEFESEYPSDLKLALDRLRDSSFRF